MKMFKLAAVIAALALALSVANLSWAAEDGAALYKTNCAMCHNADASGKPAMKAPALKGKTADDVEKAMKMPKHAAVSKKVNAAQVKAIGDYLKGLK